MKQSYKIPTSLDKSYLDTEVALQGKSGVGLRPLPLKVIGLWIATIAIVFLTIVTDKLPIHVLPLGFKFLYGASIIGMVFFASMSDAGGQSRFSALRCMCAYMFNKKSRIMKTRLTDNPTALYYMYGIKDIDTKTGMITLLDGSVCFMYRVVGNASSLLFDEDKGRIIDRVDNFYRKLPDYMRVSYITVKEPQKVISQKYNAKQLFNGLTTNDKDLRLVLQESYKTLDTFVGKEFKSLHQYLLLFANSKEYLMKAHTIVENEHNTSSLMFNAIEPLYYDDVIRCLHTIYAGE